MKTLPILGIFLGLLSVDLSAQNWRGVQKPKNLLEDWGVAHPSSAQVQNLNGKRLWASAYMHLDAKADTFRLVDSTRVLYNGTNLISESTIWKANREMAPYISERVLYEYNEQNKPVVQLYQMWSNMQWDNYSRVIYAYDANGNIRTSEVQVWNGNSWDLSQQKTIYNSNNQIVKLDHKALTQERQYDDNGYLSFVSTQLKISDPAAEFRKYYTNDADGKVISISEQTLGHSEPEQWGNSYQNHFTYTADGKLSTQLIKGWDGTNWVNSWLYSTTYNTAGLIELYKTQSWVNGAWEDHSKRQYFYDSDKSWNKTYNKEGRLERVERSYYETAK